jgi:hypothetical protein
LGFAGEGGFQIVMRFCAFEFHVSLLIKIVM